MYLFQINADSIVRLWLSSDYVYVSQIVSYAISQKKIRGVQRLSCWIYFRKHQKVFAYIIIIYQHWDKTGRCNP